MEENNREGKIYKVLLRTEKKLHRILKYKLKETSLSTEQKIIIEQKSIKLIHEYLDSIIKTLTKMWNPENSDVPIYTFGSFNSNIDKLISQMNGSLKEKRTLATSKNSLEIDKLLEEFSKSLTNIFFKEVKELGNLNQAQYDELEEQSVELVREFIEKARDALLNVKCVPIMDDIPDENLELFKKNVKQMINITLRKPVTTKNNPYLLRNLVQSRKNNNSGNQRKNTLTFAQRKVHNLPPSTRIRPRPSVRKKSTM